MKSYSYSLCPECNKWVPVELMNYDIDPETGKLSRVCTPCIEGTSEENNYIRNSPMCLYCDSNNTRPIEGKHDWFTCLDCGESFRRF